MNVKNILETISMIEEQKLDIRTITMGISLLDCIDSDGEKSREKIYNKITTCAKDLVKVGREIESEFGIPIVNKRVSVTPISIVAGACNDKDYVEFAKTLDKAAEELGIDFIGGFSALCQKGYTKGDEILIKSIPEALACTNKVCASVNVGSTRSGMNMDAIKEMGQIVKQTAELTKEQKGFGCAKLVVFCNAVEDNPFMAIIFCRTKRRVDALDEALAVKGYNCEKLHSDIPQAKRERIIKSFRKADLQYLIATDVASRGLDITGITHIYNYDIPETSEDYIHRIGRTGRIGNDGYTCMFVDPKNTKTLEKIESDIKYEIPRRLVELDK